MRRVLSGSPSTALVAAAILVGPADGAGQQTGSIQGTVVTETGTLATDAEIHLVTLHLRVRVDENGTFAFPDVPSGRHVVEATSPRYGQAVQTLTVRPGQSARVNLIASPMYHLDALVVSAGTGAQTQLEAVQPSSVVRDRELAIKAEPSLGETLSREAGVNSTYFGPGASRPIIRGLGGDRVRMLESGVGTGDVSTTSPDHAVSVEPRAQERIEVIRGPATLLYGGTASGGIVNSYDGSIPREMPSSSSSGHAELLGASVSDEFSGSGGVTVALGSKVAAHGSAFVRKTDDYSIPGVAVVEEEEHEGEPHEEEEQPVGVLPNSDLETQRGALGVSFIDRGGWVGVSVKGYDTEYGVPAAHAHADEEEPGAEPAEEEDVPIRIDLRQRRLDAEGGLRFGEGFFRQVRGRFGYTDYRHFEKEGAEIGTRFDNRSWEFRGEAEHHLGEAGSGVFGVQFGRRDLEATGEEAFIAPTETFPVAVFAYEQIPMGTVNWEVGARFERTDVRNTAEAVERDDNAISVSGGLNWMASSSVSLVGSLAYSERAPAGEELFSFGPHFATNSFEIGNADLSKERGLNGDLGIRFRSARITGSLTGFANRFSDYIFLSFTDQEQDGLPVFAYDQTKATFIGAELEADIHLMRSSAGELDLRIVSDYVRAQNTESDRPLPLIPPFRLGGSLAYAGEQWLADLGVRYVAEQTRTAEFETTTPSYTLLDASVGYRLFSGRVAHDIILQGNNLTDEEARVHTSILKLQAPLPGRNIRLTYRLSF